MNKVEELRRRAFLKEQATLLLRQDADHHEAEAKRLMAEAEMLEEMAK